MTLQKPLGDGNGNLITAAKRDRERGIEKKSGLRCADKNWSGEVFAPIYAGLLLAIVMDD